MQFRPPSQFLTPLRKPYDIRLIDASVLSLQEHPAFTLNSRYGNLAAHPKSPPDGDGSAHDLWAAGDGDLLDDAETKFCTSWLSRVIAIVDQWPRLGTPGGAEEDSSTMTIDCGVQPEKEEDLDELTDRVSSLLAILSGPACESSRLSLPNLSHRDP